MKTTIFLHAKTTSDEPLVHVVVCSRDMKYQWLVLSSGSTTAAFVACKSLKLSSCVCDLSICFGAVPSETEIMYVKPGTK